MDGINLIQDLAILLLAAAVSGTVCRRLGLSVIVGYLVAGMVIGPYTPPFSFITDVNRIQTLSQIGLVFLMFGIGLGLSLTKLGQMGWPILLATGLGAFVTLNMTQLLGVLVGWNSLQSLFMGAMLMVSSSAVIAKIVDELHIQHERSSQMALSITVLEDVVAVVMLTVLAAKTGAGTGTNVGSLLTGMSAFVVLLVGAGLLMVPRLMKRLEARADPELQTVTVAGLLFLLSIGAAKAGYSLALGAFLLGAIVAELPQKIAVEKSFAGMRDVFSSVFFVSIGIMIDARMLLDVWPLILGIGVFALVGRAFATWIGMLASGVRAREARRASLLLGPLGEFSFIIAQLGVGTAVLPKNYYAVAVGTSVFTVLMVPIINRHAERILGVFDRFEPAWLTRTLDAYDGWISQVQNSGSGSAAWKLVRGRLVQIAVEVLFVTGVMTFSRQMLEVLLRNSPSAEVHAATLTAIYWSVISIIALIPVLAIWRNVAAIAMILAESISRETRFSDTVVQTGVKGIGALLMGYWIYLILPTDQLGGWGWAAIGLAAVVVVAVFSSRLIYWHSHWQASVRDVLAEDPSVAAQAATRAARGKRREDVAQWNMRLLECVVPDVAGYIGQALSQISIPTRFGCVVLEIERNGYVITAIRPDLRLYPGDKVLLLGKEEELAAAHEFLAGANGGENQSAEFRGSVLETFHVGDGPHAGRTLAELNIGRATGTRIVGIARGDTKIIAPSGSETLESDDDVLVAGTLREITAFRRWLKTGLKPEADRAAPGAAGVTGRA